MMGHLLLAVTVLLGSAQHFLAQESCKYPNCVLRRVPNKHLIETAFVYLNLTSLPNTLATQCPRIIARAANCSSLYSSCARTVQETYDQRYQDGAFVKYIMRLGKFVCGNLQGYLHLKLCFTDALETVLRTCIVGQRFDLSCLSGKYNNTSNCTEYDNIVFHYHIKNWLPRYPFYTTG